MSEDFDIFSLAPPAEDQRPAGGEDTRPEGGKVIMRSQTQQKRFSTHLQPSDALPRSNMRHAENKIMIRESILYSSSSDTQSTKIASIYSLLIVTKTGWD